jgi:serine/threonine protein kinase
MGAVYLARHAGDGSPCALKILSGVNVDERTVLRFEREARLAASIQSPSVIGVLGAGIDPATKLHYIALEFINGPSLGAWLQSAPRTFEERKSVLEQLFRALAAAHARGIVHRDLKPDNVLVSQSESGVPGVKVLDFGIAKSFKVRTQITRPGMGAPLWTAPEQSRASAADPRADVWALGLLTFYVLTGVIYWRNVSADRSFLDLVVELTDGELAPASERARELGAELLVPAEFDAWFARAVCRSVSHRFSDAGTALDHLAPLMGIPARTRKNRSFFRAWRRIERRLAGGTRAAAPTKTWLLLTAALIGAGLLTGFTLRRCTDSMRKPSAEAVPTVTSVR